MPKKRDKSDWQAPPPDTGSLHFDQPPEGAPVPPASDNLIEGLTGSRPARKTEGLDGRQHATTLYGLPDTDQNRWSVIMDNAQFELLLAERDRRFRDAERAKDDVKHLDQIIDGYARLFPGLSPTPAEKQYIADFFSRPLA